MCRAWISKYNWFVFLFTKIDRNFSQTALSLQSNKLKLKRILSIVETIGCKKPCQVRCPLWFTTCGERYLGIRHWQKIERTLKENKIGYVWVAILLSIKVYIFWEGNKIFQNLHTVDLFYVVPVKSKVEILQNLWPSQNIWTLKALLDHYTGPSQGLKIRGVGGT